MKKTYIKRFFKIAIYTSAIVASYIIGKNIGYEKGWTDGNMATACKRCIYHSGKMVLTERQRGSESPCRWLCGVGVYNNNRKAA